MRLLQVCLFEENNMIRRVVFLGLLAYAVQSAAAIDSQERLYVLTCGNDFKHSFRQPESTVMVSKTLNAMIQNIQFTSGQTTDPDGNTIPVRYIHLSSISDIQTMSIVLHHMQKVADVNRLQLSAAEKYKYLLELFDLASLSQIKLVLLLRALDNLKVESVLYIACGKIGRDIDRYFGGGKNRWRLPLPVPERVKELIAKAYQIKNFTYLDDVQHLVTSEDETWLGFGNAHDTNRASEESKNNGLHFLFE